MNNIGLVGCGVMGKGICKNLINSGYQVNIHDNYSIWKEEMTEYGAVFIDSLQEFAQKNNIIFLSLPSPEVLKKVLNGENGILSHASPESIIIDLGTTDTITTRNMQQKAASKNIKYLDCPVSGGPSGAENGSLTIMVGAEEEDYHSSLNILELIGADITHIGPPGSGQVVKLANNTLVAGIISLLSEVMITSKAEGVEPEVVAGIIRKSSGNNKVLEVFGQNLIDQNHSNVLFSLSNMAKDIKLYSEIASQNDLYQPISSNINQLCKLGLQLNKGALDTTALYSLLVRQNEEDAPI